MTREVTKTPEPPISIRLSALERSVIDKAASASGQKLTAYIRESTLERAEMDLADYRFYALGEADMKNFMAALDQPPVVKPELQKLLSEPSVLEE